MILSPVPHHFELDRNTYMENMVLYESFMCIIRIGKEKMEFDTQ